jgi:glycosyltransferase involved in cell wall biosynthesis
MTYSVAIIGTRGYPSYYGGFETAVREIAPDLAERGWDVTVYGRPGAVSLNTEPADSRVKSVITRGFETKSLSTLSYGLSATIHAMIRKPDVALVMNVANGFWLPLLRLRGIPVLVNVDGIEWERAKWGRAAKAMFRAGALLTSKFANQIVGDSKEIIRRWHVSYRVDGIFIPYGGKIPTEVALEEGLLHRGYVLVVARFVPENTIVEFLEAASDLSDRIPVVIVGSSGYGGPIDDAARSLSEANPNVRWLGHVSDDRRLFSLWHHAAVYFHGHSVGGTNPALVQAMACGAPTVARDTVYNREVLGDAAVYVEPTPQAIFEGISSVAENPERSEKMAASALGRMMTTYTWDIVCSAYAEALQGLASNRKGKRPRG